MLEVKPTENYEKYAIDSSLTLLEVFDGGEAVGFLALDIDGTGEEKSVIIKKLECDDPFLADFLVRSAAAYGDNRYCFTLVAEKNSNQDVYKKLGFLEKDGKNVLPISKIVHKTQQN